MIPVGLIVRAIEKLVSSAADQRPEVTELFRIQHVANVKGAAFRLGGTYEEAGRRIAVRTQGALVEVGFTVRERALDTMTWVVSSQFPVFRIEKRSAFGRGKKVPRGVVPDFDDRFDIRSKDIEGIRALWTQDLCQAAYRTAPSFTCKSDGFLLELTASYPRITHLIDNGITLMRSLAKADANATALLKDLPNAAYTPAALPYASLGNTDVRIGYARLDDVMVTEARIPLRAISADAEARLRALGATAIKSGDVDTLVHWPTVIRERAKLTELVELLRTIVTPVDGVFR